MLSDFHRMLALLVVYHSGACIAHLLCGFVFGLNRAPFPICIWLWVNWFHRCGLTKLLSHEVHVMIHCPVAWLISGVFVESRLTWLWARWINFSGLLAPLIPWLTIIFWFWTGWPHSIHVWIQFLSCLNYTEIMRFHVYVSSARGVQRCHADHRQTLPEEGSIATA